MRKILLFSMPLPTWHFVDPQLQSRLISRMMIDDGPEKIIAAVTTRIKGFTTGV